MKLNKKNKKQFVNLPPHPGNRGNMTHHTSLCLTFSCPGTSLSSGCRCPRPPLWIIAHLCFTVCMCFCYQNLYIYSDSFANLLCGVCPVWRGDRMVPVPLGGTFFLGGWSLNDGLCCRFITLNQLKSHWQETTTKDAHRQPDTGPGVSRLWGRGSGR